MTVLLAHPVLLAALAAGLLLAAGWVLAFHVVPPSRKMRLNRARAMRTRLHLRLRPLAGLAGWPELWVRWGRFAAWRKAARIRPGLSFRARLAVWQCSVLIGRAHYWLGLRVPLDEHRLILGPPREGKTGMLGALLITHPGPAVATSTKPDLYSYTSGLRARHGHVAVLSPQLIGGLGSTFAWDPVDGCDEPATAIRRADFFTCSVSQKGVEDGSFWTGKASDYMRAYFFAAALAGLDLRAVARWVTAGEVAEPARILADVASAGGPNAETARLWAAQLGELSAGNHKTAATVKMTLSRSIQFMADPLLRQAVLPAPGQGLDIGAFCASTGTLYLVAEHSGDQAPLASLFACLTGEIHWTACLQGSRTPAGRLDPPLLLALDEVTQICPVPLPHWLADAGGKGVVIQPVVHGFAQIEERWGEQAARIVADTCSVRVFLPGIADAGTLEHAARLCGRTPLGMPGQEHATMCDILPPDLIRQLPPRFALVLRRSYAPVIAKLPMIWRTSAYRRARAQGWATLPQITAAVEPVPAQGNGHADRVPVIEDTAVLEDARD